MSKIHPSAVIGKSAQAGENNVIEANVIIEDGVRIGAHNHIRAGAYLCAGTTLGDYNDIHMYAIVGHTPQDVAFKNEPTFTKIGNHNTIREFATIHRGTKGGSSTLIGDHNYLMAYSHVAHNCEIGNHVTLVNQASLTGYCIVEDYAFLSGMTGLHQFTRVGKLVMLSALSAVNKDIPPFMICGGRPAVILGINVVGLRRAGVPAQVRDEIKQAYKYLYRSGLNVSQALDTIKAQLRSAEVNHLVSFIEKSKRGICDGGGSGQETLRPKNRRSNLPQNED